MRESGNDAWCTKEASHPSFPNRDFQQYDEFMVFKSNENDSGETVGLCCFNKLAYMCMEIWVRIAQI